MGQVYSDSLKGPGTGIAGGLRKPHTRSKVGKASSGSVRSTDTVSEYGTAVQQRLLVVREAAGLNRDLYCRLRELILSRFRLARSREIRRLAVLPALNCMLRNGLDLTIHLSRPACTFNMTVDHA